MIMVAVQLGFDVDDPGRSPGGVFSSRWVESSVKNGVFPHLMSLLLLSGTTGLFPIKNHCSISRLAARGAEWNLQVFCVP